MSNETEPKEVKVILTFKGNRASVGIQQTDCDPVFFKKEGALGDVLAAIPDFVVTAGQKWGTSPRYPKAELPTPPPAATTVRRPAAAAAAKPTAQTPMF